MLKVFSTIILLGVMQGFILTILLLSSKQNKKANGFLALLILLITLASLNLYGNYSNWFGSNILRNLAQIIPLIIVMPLGPLIWFYAQAMLNPEFRITKIMRRHFYPVIIDLVPSLIVIFYIAGTATNFIVRKPEPWANFVDTYNVYADIPRWLSVTWYVWISAKHLSGFKNRINGNINGYEKNMKWLRQFIRSFMVFQVIWLIYLVPYIIPRYTSFMLDTFSWYPIYIPMAILIYWLGIKGYIIAYQQITADKKSLVNNLSPDLIGSVVISLTKVMESNKAYLNPNLNLSVMAKMTGFPEKTISAVLNQHLQKSFNLFVNSYRLEEFKDKLSKSDWQHLKISALASECGFNSQATFQRTFKESMGMAPSEYLKSALNIS